MLPFHPTAPNLGPAVHRGPARTTGTPRTRPGTAARTTSGCRQGHDDDGVPGPQRHPVPLRAGRRVHHLRRLPLLAARPDRPEPLLHVDGLGRQRRPGRRPGAGQRRGGLRLGDLPGEARGRRVSAGRSTRTSAQAWTRPTSGAGRTTPTSATTATTRCCTSTSTRTPPPGTPLAEKAKTGTNIAHRRPRLLRHPQGGRAGRQAPAGVLDRRARGVLRAPELAGQLRRLVHRAGPRRAHGRPGRVEQDGAVHHVRRERRLLRPRRHADAADLRGQRRLDGGREPTTSSRATPSYVAGPYGLGPRVPMLVVSPVEHRRLRQLRGLRPHLDHPLRREALRRARAERLGLAAHRLRRPDLGLRLLQGGRRAARPAEHLGLRPAGPRPAHRATSRTCRPTR